ncbi:MAG: EAL domain-containing protein [Gammaproteobacteria bacterium]
MPYAEEFKLMPDTDRWVVAKAPVWLESDGAILNQIEKCAINLAGRSTSAPSFHLSISDLRGEHSALTARLCSEITERAAISNLKQAVECSQCLRHRDCSVSLDDFGTGLASFEYLKRQPVDYAQGFGIGKPRALAELLAAPLRAPKA